MFQNSLGQFETENLRLNPFLGEMVTQFPPMVILLLLVCCLNKSITKAEDLFDFIVVGAGTAGCTVAGRLAESHDFSVLLLESGPVPNPGLDIPAVVGRYHPGHLKRFDTVKQEGAGLLNNGSIPYLIGSTLGGGSSVNGLIFNRGHPLDYQLWSELTGDLSWSYESMLEHFRRLETYMGEFPSLFQHGYSGPVTVSRPRYSPGMNRLREAGLFLGFPWADPNGPQTISFAPSDAALRNGRRVSSYTAFIKPQSGNKLLKVITGATVTKVKFEGERASGVEYVLNQKVIFAKAKLEVILSGGVIETPNLLMKSGVGPEVMLKERGIPVIKVLPGVGQNFHDHVLVQLEFAIKSSSPSDVFIPERDLTPEAFQLYRATGDGPFAVIPHNTQAFMVSSGAHLEGESNWPDIEVQFVSAPILSISGNGTQGLEKGETGIGCQLYNMRPKSRGEVGLHPDLSPKVDFRFFHHPGDIKVMVDGIRQVLKVYEATPAFQRVGGRYRRAPLKPCDHFEFRSEEYWECYIRHRTLPGLHGVGTCRMGRAEPWKDSGAVLDSELRVIGLKGLRVVDGSAIPVVTNANTMAAIYGLAEKGAEMILRSWEGERERRRFERVEKTGLHFGWKGGG